MSDKIFSNGCITLIFHEKDSELKVLSTSENKCYFIEIKGCATIIGPNDTIKFVSKTEDILESLEKQGFKEIKSNNQKLKELVIKILNQTGDDPCWMDWNGLYKELANLCGLKDWKPKIFPKEVMLKNCEYFINCMLEEAEYKKQEYAVDADLLRLIYLHLILPFPDDEKEERKKIIEALKEILKNDEILHIER